MSEVSLAKKELGWEPIIKSYYLLIRAPIVNERTIGGIILLDSTKEDEQRRERLAKILKRGHTSFEGTGEPYKTSVGKWIIYMPQERSPIVSLNKDVIAYCISDDRIIIEIPDEDAKTILDKKGWS
jgi:co-chaperonin GroES (HSP10)